MMETGKNDTNVSIDRPITNLVAVQFSDIIHEDQGVRLILWM